MRKGEKRMRGLRAEGVKNEGPESGEDKGWGERTVVRLKGEEDSNGEDREREREGGWRLVRVARTVRT